MRPPLPRAVVAAGVLFFDDAGRVMLVHTTYKQPWEIPGGVVESERGESPVDAARREVAEELGLDITVGALLTIDSAADGVPGIAFVFDGGVLSAQQLAKIEFVDGELDGFRFCGPDEVRALLTPRLARRVLSTLAVRDEGWPLPRFLRHGV
ncbi:NUDIX domain-containing protein [Labedaea rhizosphaerae]|uniref:8-oxo-dGTP pyrophosphatase MutT (NUDIX family) n=1 Tax=Labedaea rhizosphaerae TaxID=598644 RepID=A0A4R6SLC3_LABRH|nr:NUDIX hydrolase [Labedaea rhizosphaerae]TDQ04092.1 8-oxo-dGTP pyrophosphatase MutT (NUDIX family) [Labedaea rhizosphaerae]